VESIFQADPEIARLAISGSVEAILSGDSDFSLHIGPSRMSNTTDSLGVDFMLAKPKIRLGQDRSLQKMIIITGQSKLAEQTAEFLRDIKPSENVEYFPKRPQYPLLDGEDNPQILGLFV
jgi:hypothetical protein